MHKNEVHPITNSSVALDVSMTCSSGTLGINDVERAARIALKVARLIKVPC